MELGERVIEVLDRLEEHYGPTKCYLTHENAWQLLISTILSAQCTDDRVNMVTKDLFKKYPVSYTHLSSLLCAFVIPTEEPALAGLTKHGYPSFFSILAAVVLILLISSDLTSTYLA